MREPLGPFKTKDPTPPLTRKGQADKDAFNKTFGIGQGSSNQAAKQAAIARRLRAGKK